MIRPVLLTVTLVILLSAVASSLPRFASRTNFACRNCHVNPTGGGMRSPFGVSYGRDEVPIKSWQEQFALDDFSTNLTDFLSYGVDFRLLYFYQDKDNPKTERSSFFPMQADVYFNFALSKKVNLFVNPAFGPTLDIDIGVEVVVDELQVEALGDQVTHLYHHRALRELLTEAVPRIPVAVDAHEQGIALNLRKYSFTIHQDYTLTTP